MTGYLVVKANDTSYALPVWGVIEVGEAADVLPAPFASAAVRGVTVGRNALVPLVHLGALLSETPAPSARGAAVVLAVCGGTRIAFEVEGVDTVMEAETVPLPAGWMPPCSTAMARCPEGLVPVLDLDAIKNRLAAAAAVETR